MNTMHILAQHETRHKAVISRIMTWHFEEPKESVTLIILRLVQCSFGNVITRSVTLGKASSQLGEMRYWSMTHSRFT